ncbi:uncharacterized protein LOC121397804 [Xenopus laevis]|uniref:Uncharacterized protein LOC121397804 n=1 Tax=Xenopus laevis TaxID=8355 RepID=A0A8J1LQ31_XENLA|nr:uncharacterized protein LOC121397804 [Xenopus laevis]XP_041431345.1 uncharacterized protein LOC121397804 [Xenopus laevis]XP_041431346.1 uncharacterized protein LOC121397804 [Xenopus laevis]
MEGETTSSLGPSQMGEPIQLPPKKPSSKRTKSSASGSSKRPRIDVSPPESSPPPPEMPDWLKDFQKSFLGMTSSIEKLATAAMQKQKPTNTALHTAHPSTSETCPESSEEDPSLDPNDSDSDQLDTASQPSKRSQTEAVDALLADMFITLDLQEETKEIKTLDKLFGSVSKPQRHFPVHETVEEVIKKEWKFPDRKLARDKRLDNLYPFQQQYKDKWDQVPKVDAPVARLAKRTTIPLEDGTSFKDPMDRKTESLLKNIFTSTTSAFKPTIAMACVARTLTLWAQEAIQEASEEEFDMSSHLSKMLNAIHYLCDASMDSLHLLAKSSALAIAARRALWLKPWSADPASKKNLVSLPFTGTTLFGSELDAIISKISGVRAISYPRTRDPGLHRIHNARFDIPTTSVFNRIFRGIRDLIPGPTLRVSGVLESQHGTHNVVKPRRPRINKIPDALAASIPQETVGGRLRFFKEVWLSNTSDTWVHKVITYGYEPFFQQPPPTRFLRSRIPTNPDKKAEFFRAIQEMRKKGGHRSSTYTPTQSRFLFKPFHGSQKGRFSATSLRSKETESLSSGPYFQDGISESSHRQCRTGRLFHLDRLKGCLSTHPHPSTLSKIPAVCTTQRAFSVSSSSLRSGHGTENFHQGHGQSSGLHEGTASNHYPISGRSPSPGSIQRDRTTTHRYLPIHTTATWVDNSPSKELFVSSPVHSFFGGTLRFSKTQGVSHSRKNSKADQSDFVDHSQVRDFHKKWNASLGINDGIDRSGTLRTIPHETASTGTAAEMEQVTNNTRRQNLSVAKHQTVLVLVDTETKSGRGTCMFSNKLSHGYHRCESSGLGRSFPGQDGTGKMVANRGSAADQRPRTSSYPTRSSALDHGSARFPSKDTNRQCYRCSLSKSSRRHTQSSSLERGSQDTYLGRTNSPTTFCHLHSRPGQLGSGLSQSADSRPRGMEAEPSDIRADCQEMGMAPNRSHGIDVQSSATDVLHTVPRLQSRSNRCADYQLELRSGLCVSATTNDSQGSEKTEVTPYHSHCNSTILAQEGMVFGLEEHVHSRPLETTTAGGPVDPGSVPTSQSEHACPDGLAIEAAIWSQKGFSHSVVQTLLQARKKSTKRSYHRIWKIFLEWCNRNQLNHTFLPISDLLDFLQQGLDKGLATSSLKVQVSALSILLQQPLAEQKDVKTFLQAAQHIRPRWRAPTPPWDLTLVLNALQKPPFEPMHSISIKLLSLKVVFLVAIASARRVSELAALSCRPPLCVIHEDKVVLRTQPEFIPKVVSDYHINQDIVLPSLCPKPKNSKEKALHTLDVVRAIKYYLHRTQDFRKSETLFVLFGAPQRGKQASSASLSRWIRETIILAYTAKGKPAPFRVTAHSTRALSTSWAQANQASADQICRAATWSSVHTFTKFYKFNVYASSQASFGRKVLQAAVL